MKSYEEPTITISMFNVANDDPVIATEEMANGSDATATAIKTLTSESGANIPLSNIAVTSWKDIVTE